MILIARELIIVDSYCDQQYVLKFCLVKNFFTLLSIFDIVEIIITMYDPKLQNNCFNRQQYKKDAQFKATIAKEFCFGRDVKFMIMIYSVSRYEEFLMEIKVIQSFLRMYC